jgi:hypothetical protein
LADRLFFAILKEPKVGSRQTTDVNGILNPG